MGLARHHAANRPRSLSVQDIERLGVIAKREAGISLNADKADFLMARLDLVLEQAGLTDYAEYCDLLEHAAGRHVHAFLEAITTHTTSFFREVGQFDWLDSEGLGTLAAAGAGRSRDLVIWSAACSTGQELYSAMMQAQSFANRSVTALRVSGIGTDLAPSVVATARNAVYDDADISGIPVDMRRRFLLSAKSADGRHRIGPQLRDRTDWRPANLTKPQTLSGIDADLIFLRNVLIYFNEDTQKVVLRNVLDRLRPGGFLLTGHSETACVRDCGLKMIKPTIYQKVAP